MHRVNQSVPKTCFVAHLPRFAILVAAAAITFVVANGAAVASDFFHECEATSIGAGYRLSVKKRSYQLRKSGVGAPIDFTRKKKTQLRELSGICVGRKRRYRYETLIYLLDLEIKVDGKTKPLQFRCEKSTDATPAGVQCVREIKLIDWQSPLIGQKR